MKLGKNWQPGRPKGSKNKRPSINHKSDVAGRLDGMNITVKEALHM